MAYIANEGLETCIFFYWLTVLGVMGVLPAKWERWIQQTSIWDLV